MTGLFWILLCWLLGNLLSRLCGRYVSGNVIGSSMALFFVPFGVGLMVSYRIIAEHFWAIVAAAGISTIAVLAVTGRTFQWLNGKNDAGRK